MQNCFLLPSRLKSHIILVLDRPQCVARVNCLVRDNNSTPAAAISISEVAVALFVAIVVVSWKQRYSCVSNDSRNSSVV